MSEILLAPRVTCKDGVSLSVQVGWHAYCIPRDNDGPHVAKEVGFIKDANGVQMAPPDSWEPYADGGFPSDVYGYVPTEMIKEFIASHGGHQE